LDRASRQKVARTLGKRQPRKSLAQFHEEERARLEDWPEPPAIDVRELVTYPIWEEILEDVSATDSNRLGDAYELYNDVAGVNLRRQHSDAAITAACQELGRTFMERETDASPPDFRYEECARFMMVRTGLPRAVCEAFIDASTVERFVQEL
jgi:hypothetical protein